MPTELIEQLIQAVQNGNLDLCTALIGQGADVNAVDKHDNSLLFLAVSYNKPIISKLLLDNGANIHPVKLNIYPFKSPCYTTLLHYAARSRKPNLSKSLLDRGATIDAVDHEGRTPLHEAAHFGNPQTCDLLLQYQANIHAVDHKGCTPLHEAATHHGESTATCRILLKYHAALDARDHSGKTPLHAAAATNNWRESHDLFKLLLEKGADIHAVDHKGRTPLHWAAMHDNVPMCQALLSLGADISHTDNQGFTARDLANQAPNTAYQFLHEQMQSLTNHDEDRTSQQKMMPTEENLGRVTYDRAANSSSLFGTPNHSGATTSDAGAVQKEQTSTKKLSCPGPSTT